MHAGGGVPADVARAGAARPDSAEDAAICVPRAGGVSAKVYRPAARIAGQPGRAAAAERGARGRGPRAGKEGLCFHRAAGNPARALCANAAPSRAGGTQPPAGGSVRGDRRRAVGRRRALFALWRHGQRQDGGLHARGGPRAGIGARGHRAGAGNRAHAADGFLVPRAVCKRGGDPLAPERGRAVRRVAARRFGRSPRGGGRALGGVFAGGEPGPDRGGRGARTHLPLRAAALLRRAPRGASAHGRAGRRAGARLGHAGGEHVYARATGRAAGKPPHIAGTFAPGQWRAAAGGAHRGYAPGTGAGQHVDFLRRAGERAARLSRGGAAGDSLHQPARVFHVRFLPHLRARGKVRGLRFGDDLSPQRRCARLPLLRAHAQAAQNLSGMRQPVHQILWRGHPKGGRRGARVVPPGARFARGLGHHARQGRARAHF